MTNEQQDLDWWDWDASFRYSIWLQKIPTSSVHLDIKDDKIEVHHTEWHYPDRWFFIRKTITRAVLQTALVLFGVAFPVLVILYGIIDTIINIPKPITLFHWIVGLTVWGFLLAVAIVSYWYRRKIIETRYYPKRQNWVFHSFTNDGFINFRSNLNTTRVHAFDILSINLTRFDADTTISNAYNFGNEIEIVAQKQWETGRLIRVTLKDGTSFNAARFHYNDDQALPIVTAIKRAYEATLKAAPLP